MTFEPFFDRVLIKPIVEEKEEKKGMFVLLNKDTNEIPSIGYVISVGSGKVENDNLIKPTVEPGMVVMFGKFAGQKILLQDEEHIIMRENEIYGAVYYPDNEERTLEEK